MTAKPRRPIRILITAAVVAAALTAGALAASNGILSLTTLFSGTQIVKSVGEDGFLRIDITGSTDQERNPVVVRGDRVYFTTETCWAAHRKITAILSTYMMKAEPALPC